jgi:mRNA-degrading endonuclease toxin of MazEF toxin-antitoxin module
MNEIDRGDIIHLVDDQGVASLTAVVVQSLAFAALPSLLICPLSYEEVDAPILRIPVGDGGNLGLAGPAWAMAELLTAVPRATRMQTVGRVDGQFFREFDRALVAVLGIA